MFILYAYSVFSSLFILTGTHFLLTLYKYIKKGIISTTISDFSLLGVYLLWILVCIFLPYFMYYCIVNNLLKNNVNLNNHINVTLNIIMLIPTIIYGLAVKNPFK